MTELTLSIIKPDATKRNITGKINTLIEESGLQIVAQKRVLLTRKESEQFYRVHKELAFFDDLCDFMISGPVILQALKGENAVAKYREIMGTTNPINANEGTIRKMYGQSVGHNSVHGSDSIENAAQEISFFFSQCEIIH